MINDLAEAVFWIVGGAVGMLAIHGIAVALREAFTDDD